MADAAILKIDDLEVFQRGDGVETTLLVGAERVTDAHVTTGITRFPAGRRAPMHSHNCGEQVTILEGTAECVVDGRTTVLKPYDTTFIPAERPHCFHNAGDGPLVILWIYDTDNVTRTFTETGETVQHLSTGDKVS